MGEKRTIKGKIIRILDKKTVIINLGSRDGIDSSTRFSILAKPEKIIDPDTEEELGKVNVIKSKLKAKQVNEKFTIASTQWTIRTTGFRNTLVNNPLLGGETETIDYGELNVPDEEIEPWKATTEIPVKKGDKVEAEIKIPQKEKTEAKETNETETTEKNNNDEDES